jgi:hypothetical protein
VSEADAADKERRRRAMLDVAEMRAGLRPLPGPGAALDPVTRMVLMLTAEAESMVGELERELGRERARSLVFREKGCTWSGGWGGLRSG